MRKTITFWGIIIVVLCGGFSYHLVTMPPVKIKVPQRSWQDNLIAHQEKLIEDMRNEISRLEYHLTCEVHLKEEARMKQYIAEENLKRFLELTTTGKCS